MANETIYTIPNQVGNFFHEEDGGAVSGNTYMRVGQYLGTPAKGALRFPGIPISQGVSVNEVKLLLFGSSVGAGSGNLKCKVWGIDEDDCPFFSTNPFTLGRTSASATEEHPLPSSGNFMQAMTVTSLANEVFARAGWAYGNALGFTLEDNGSPSDVWLRDSATPTNCILSIRIDALPDFTPSPKTVSAPSLPAADHYGIKSSPPGVSVLEATEEELYHTTKKYQYKIITQGLTSCLAGVTKVLNHDLGYRPHILCYARKNGYSFKLPRLFDGASDPVGSGVQGVVGVDEDNLYISLTQDADVYYYIFLDAQAT